MRVTTFTEYSLIVTLHLARRQGQRHLSAADLAAAEGLPADYVEQILLKLRRAGVVDSVRGAHGGYRFTRDPASVSVYEVMSACDRQTFEINCDAHPLGDGRCAPDGNCSIRPVWQALRDRVDGFLRGVSLADLMQDEAQVRAVVRARAAV